MPCTTGMKVWPREIPTPSPPREISSTVDPLGESCYIIENVTARGEEILPYSVTVEQNVSKTWKIPVSIQVHQDDWAQLQATLMKCFPVALQSMIIVLTVHTF